MKKIYFGFSLLSIFWLVSCISATPVPTVTPAPTSTSTNTPAPTATFTATATQTPTFTPQPSFTPIPTNSPTLEPTVQVIEISDALPTLEVPDWPVVLSDDFTTNEHRWPIDLFPDQETLISNSGQYVLWTRASKWEISWKRPISFENLTSFYVAVEAKYFPDTGLGNYGLIFRHDVENYYIFVINDEGWFTIGKVVHRQYEPLVMWSVFLGIKPGEYNHLAVIGVGAGFKFFINGYQVASLSNGELQKGKVALAALLLEPGDTSAFLFDNFELRAPQK